MQGQAGQGQALTRVSAGSAVAAERTRAQVAWSRNGGARQEFARCLIASPPPCLVLLLCPAARSPSPLPAWGRQAGVEVWIPLCGEGAAECPIAWLISSWMAACLAVCHVPTSRLPPTATPVALPQVYKGVLRSTGEAVAVKVRGPGARGCLPAVCGWQQPAHRALFGVQRSAGLSDMFPPCACASASNARTPAPSCLGTGPAAGRAGDGDR